MKLKKIISAIITFGILFVFAAAASANYSVSITYADGKVNISNIDSGILVAAASKDNQIEKIKTYDISQFTDGIPVNDDFYNGDNVKLMLWDSLEHMESWAEAVEATISGAKDAPVIVTVPAADFDYENTAYTDNNYIAAGALYFYNSDEFPIDNRTKLYVNGIEYENVNDGIYNYIIDNNISDVIFTDSPDDNNEFDGIYDSIAVDYYVSAVIGYMEGLDTKDPYIYLYTPDSSSNVRSLYPDERHSFTKNGREISVNNLKENDILSIQYNVTGNVNQSDFYNIKVSSDIVEGNPEAYNVQSNSYRINGVEYKTANNIRLEFGTSYKLYIDAFGRIAYAIEITPPKQLAVLDCVYYNAVNDAYNAKLIFPDGSSNTYQLNSDYNDALLTAYTTGGKKPVQNRVVEYSIDSNDMLSLKNALEPITINNISGYGGYDREQNSIYFHKINDNAVLMNATDSLNITSLSTDNLVDGCYYEAYFYDQSSEDNSYRFVLITSGLGDITSTARIAIFKEAFSAVNDNGEDTTAYKLFIDGEEKNVNWDAGEDADYSLAEGDAILYGTNLSGEITNIIKLFTDSMDLTSFDNIWSAALISTDALINKEAVTSLKGSDSSDLYFGAVIAKDSISFDIGDITDGKTDTLTASNLMITSDINVYVVDYNMKAGSRTSISTKSEIIKTAVPSIAYIDDEKNIIDWTLADLQPRLVLVKALDGDATDVVVIIPKN